MKGIWENGYTADHDFPEWELDDVAKEMKELATKLEKLPRPGGEEFDEIIEKNVEDALKSYAENAHVRMGYVPGVFDVHLWCDTDGIIASIPVDIRQELTTFADEIKGGAFCAEGTELNRATAWEWAETLEQLAAMLRGC